MYATAASVHICYSMVPRYPRDITDNLHENVILGKMSHELSCKQFISVKVVIRMCVVGGMVGVVGRIGRVRELTRSFHSKFKMASRPGVCRLEGRMVRFAGCACVRDAVWCKSGAHSVQIV